MLETQDHYFHLAKKDGYVARSAYKLQEIDEKFKLFGFNSRRESGPITIIDIGCAPGSWLQYTSRRLHHLTATSKKLQATKPENGRLMLEAGSQHPLIIGFDLKKVEINLPYTTTFVQDITEQDQVKKIINEQLGVRGNLLGASTKELITNTSQVDVIISDMAPDTVGNKGTDALRSCSLVMETMRMYETLLKKDGKFTIKVFMGPGFDDLVSYCRERRGASHIKIFKPKACRKESKETYIVKI